MHRLFRHIPLVAVAVIVLLCGCDDSSNTKATQTATTEGDETTDTNFRHGDWKPADDPSRLRIAGLEFAKPVTWIETQPMSNLRDFNYTVPAAPGEDAAELAVFFMPDAQSVEFEEHVKRWAVLFQPDEDGLTPPPLRMELPAGDVDVPAVRFDGAYQKAGAAWFTPEYTLIAAMLIGEGGQVVLRLAGPTSTVNDQQMRFYAMIESMREIADESQSESTPNR